MAATADVSEKRSNFRIRYVRNERKRAERGLRVQRKAIIYYNNL